VKIFTRTYNATLEDLQSGGSMTGEFRLKSVNSAVGQQDVF